MINITLVANKKIKYQRPLSWCLTLHFHVFSEVQPYGQLSLEPSFRRHYSLELKEVSFNFFSNSSETMENCIMYPIHQLLISCCLLLGTVTNTVTNWLLHQPWNWQHNIQVLSANHFLTQRVFYIDINSSSQDSRNLLLPWHIVE